MSYRHKNTDNTVIDLPVGKAICVGRNYAAHAAEMNEAIPEKPLLFMKPSTALCDVSPQFAIPTNLGSCHHELEIALLIGKTINKATPIALEEQVYGFGLALDLTLRDIQTKLKQKGQPWERAKAFDNSCPLSQFVPWAAYGAEDLAFSLKVNGSQRQLGNTAQLLFSFTALLESIAQVFTLNPGDVVLTGTPAGVGELSSGDQLELELQGYLKQSAKVLACQ